MPPGDLEAARRLAVVVIELPHAFFSPHAGVREALLHTGLSFEIVASSVGAMYLRFACGAERDEAIRGQPFFLDEARVELHKEEEYDRQPHTPGVCALLAATGFQAEHVNPVGIAAMFSRFGKVLEIDPTTLAGHDMSSVCVIVLLHRARDVPCDIGPIGGPWGSRTASVHVVRTWPRALSFTDAGVYVPRFPAAPATTVHAPPWPPPFLGVPLSRRLGSSAAPEGGRPGNTPRGGRQLAMLLRLHGAPPFDALSMGDAAPPAPAEPVGADDALHGSTHSSPWSVVGSRRSRFSIVELPADDAAPALLVVPRVSLPGGSDAEEEPALDMRRARKAKGKKRREAAVASHRSSRIALMDNGEFVSIPDHAAKRRDLLDALTGCSPRLRAKAVKNQVVDAIRKPLPCRAVSGLRAAAAIPVSVPSSADGLGDDDKCGLVRDAILDARPSIVCIQESKLSSLDRVKLRSFLPPYFSDFASRDDDGSQGGIVTAWDSSSFSLVASSHDAFTLTTILTSTATDLSFTVTNVYAPANHALTRAFFREVERLHSTISGPWILCGDLNLIRYPHEKNNPNFDRGLADAFNTMINDLALFELPLADRCYTWTNHRSPPTLAKLDRFLFNDAWDLAFPDSSLASRPRVTSDHFPLLDTASTIIPASHRFFFENSWLLHHDFLPTTLPAWVSCDTCDDAAGNIAARVKRFRFAAKCLKKTHKFIHARDSNCKFVIDLFDFLEESRALSGDEILLRSAARAALELSTRTQAAFWKQRGKFRGVCEGDENTRFFHAMATQRRRRNQVRSLDIDGAIVSSHRAKAEALHGFYHDLLGSARPTQWAFDLAGLYTGSAVVDGARLVAPFTNVEVKAAVDGLNRNSAPGPDGLGPSFY
ncbi:hypothetical protein ACQ4PT_003607 [Festuca glaucescens]